MVVARRGKQQCLAVGAERLADTRQHEMTDDFGTGRTARLAGYDSVDAGSTQPIGQQPDLGRFTGALAALEGDEAPARRSGRQAKLPTTCRRRRGASRSSTHL